MAEDSIDRFGDLVTPPSSDAASAPQAKRGLSAVTSLFRSASDQKVERNVASVRSLIKDLANAKFNKWLMGDQASSANSDTTSRIANESRNAQSRYSQINANGGRFQNFMGGFTESGGTGKWAGAGNAAAGVMAFGAMATNIMDNRINQMYGRSLSYDKLSMLYQQTQGITQNRFANAVLQPLSQYRLGQGGASSLLALQAQTGLSAAGNAAGIAGLRTATGFAYSTQDMAQMMATLANPMVNNRMTMTMGTGMYGPGGKQRDMMSVIQQVVRSSGLTNERMVRSGMQIGSITRARLSALGLPEDMQNMVLQYAQSNIEYQKKGGAGMYNPNDPRAQKLMGINKNFALQQEETQRVSEARDMQFYKRQADNYAQLEKNTQGLIKAFGALEDKLSGVIGARVSTRNQPTLSKGKFFGGLALTAAGIGLGFTGFGAAVAPGLTMAGIGMTASGLKGFSSGDPMPVGKKEFSIGFGGKKTTLSGFTGSPTISKLHPKFRERILKMIQDNPAVGVGEGFRSGATQRSLFNSRYEKTGEKTDIFWEGSYWKKKPNVAPAAPPGFSMHEIGLAADLTGDIDWVQKNASKYGLKTFANVNGEPWHVQPAELADGRSEYEKSGAKWGMGGATERTDPNARITGMKNGIVSDKSMGAGGGVRAAAFSQMSITDSMMLARQANLLNLASGGGGQDGMGRRSVKSKTNASGMKTYGRGVLKAEEVAQALYKAGFRGDDLAKALAIAYRESHFNTNAFNGNSKTGDLSYGLYQINMKGALGSSRRQSQKLTTNEQLYDPDTNIRVLRNMYNWNKGHGRDPFYDWGPYKKMSPTYGAASTFYPKAQAIAKQMQGDPMPMSRGGSGGATAVIDGGQSITIHAPITIHGSGNVDTHKVSQEAARVIERELKIAMMRKN